MSKARNWRLERREQLGDGGIWLVSQSNIGVEDFSVLLAPGDLGTNDLFVLVEAAFTL